MTIKRQHKQTTTHTPPERMGLQKGKLKIMTRQVEMLVNREFATDVSLTVPSKVVTLDTQGSTINDKMTKIPCQLST